MLKKSSIYYPVLPILLILFAVSILINGCEKDEKPLIVYCGGALKGPMEEIKMNFEKKYNIKINAVYGGVLSLINTIKKTQKGDIFFYPSDSSKPKLANLEHNLQCIAVDRLKIIVDKENSKKINSFTDLAKDGVRFAVGDPRKNMAGRVFAKILQKLPPDSNLEKNIALKTPTSSHQLILLARKDIDAAIILGNIVNSLKYKDFESINFPPDIDGAVEINISELTISLNKKAAQLFAAFTALEGKDIFPDN